MVGLAETMMTADSLRLTAYSPDKDRIRFVERAGDGSRLKPIGSGQVDAHVYGQYD